MARRYGRDSMTGGKQHSWLAAIGGFLLAPAAVGIAAGMGCKAMKVATPQGVATAFAGAHVAGLAASWWGAKRYPQAHSLLRGAMWGEGVVATLATASAASIVNIPLQNPSAPAGTVSASLTAGDPNAQMKQLAAKLIQGGWVKP